MLSRSHFAMADRKQQVRKTPLVSCNCAFTDTYWHTHTHTHAHTRTCTHRVSESSSESRCASISINQGEKGRWLWLDVNYCRQAWIHTQDVEIHKADYTLAEAVQKYLLKFDKIGGKSCCQRLAVVWWKTSVPAFGLQMSPPPSPPLLPDSYIPPRVSFGITILLLSDENSEQYLKEKVDHS